MPYRGQKVIDYNKLANGEPQGEEGDITKSEDKTLKRREKKNGDSDHDRQSSDATTQTHKHDEGGCAPDQFKCDLCEKSFDKYVKLRIHMRVHPIEANASRSFKIVRDTNDSDECLDDVSVQSSDVTTFDGRCLPVHPYACDICDKTLTSSDNLKIHRRTHAGENAYKCDLCEKSFGRCHDLINHRRVHTGERPYTCDLCKRSFSESGSLKRHMRVHTRERPYKCDIGLCKNSFPYYSNLSEHKRDHTENRLIFCGMCGDSFKGTSTLWTHIDKDHSKNECESKK